ncbi:uncharacterized protein [Leptinotarsa decemlineata]|uniref:uncharacterized protein n=1 Tax=Leptinotarsa decemlineata TaxID=7539 RepID=UPI003D308B49
MNKMTWKSLLFSCILFLGAINAVLCSSFIECPDVSKANVLTLDLEKHKSATVGSTTLDFRLPESGLFHQPISCIVITDLSTDGSGGDVSIIFGGIGSRTVEINIVSQLLKGLDYRVQIYSEN